MRKYKIPRFMYALLLIAVLVLSVDYTYAYFSATKVATADLAGNNVTIEWVEYDSLSTLSGLFPNSGNSISLSNNLQLGQYMPIRCLNEDGVTETDVYLGITNASTVSVYCRIKISATYLDGQGVAQECGQYISLYKKDAVEEGQPQTYSPLTSLGWKYEAGYYYYKDSALKSLIDGGTIPVADTIYLDQNADPAMFGRQVNLLITVEAIQTENNPYIYLNVDYNLAELTDSKLTVQKGSTIADLPVQEFDGYVFNGWYSDSNYTLQYSNSDVLTASTTVYAKYTKV